MSTTPNQLSDIYKILNENFHDHPLITLEPLKGDPPDQYAVTYKIKGLQGTTENGVSIQNEHTIKLTIPFGFPHFPPSCKPQSSIFHPDVDPGAIRIGDFWEKTPSLPELIIHIGQMINGELYSTEDCFNIEAGEYYAKNSEDFPFTNVSWDDAATTAPLDSNHFSANVDEIAKTLEEFSRDQDNVSLELEKSELFDYTVYEQEKKFFTLQKEISDLTEFSPELRSKFTETKSIIRKAEKLHATARNQESQGKANKALKSYKQVLELVADYPAIHSDIKRLEQTVELLAGLTDDEQDFDSLQFKASDGTLEKGTKGKENDLFPVKKQKKRSPKRKFSLNKSTLAFPLVIAVIVGIFFGLKRYSLINLEKAQSSFETCSGFYDSKNYAAAKMACESSLAFSGKVFFFFNDQTSTLKKSVNRIFNSEDFKNGILGKILVDGKYISRTEAKNHAQLISTIKKAEAFNAQGNLKQAAETFAQAAQLAMQSTPPDAQLEAELLTKCNAATYTLLITEIEGELQANNWSAAKTKIAEAKQLIQRFPPKKQQLFADNLSNLMNASQLGAAKESGRTAMNNGEWDKAAAAFDQALKLATTHKPNLKKQIETIKEELKKIELYQTLERGNDAFASGEWDKAIKAYSSASHILTASQGEAASTTTFSMNRKKLNKIILQASIIRDQQSIKKMLSNEELKSARDAYRNLLSVIQSSNLVNEKEFSKAEDDIKSKIKELNKKIYLAEKKQYLEQNYRDLFTRHYPNANKDALEKPVIKMVENNNRMILYRMQCTERKSGRPLNLVMHYAYNKKLNTWSLSTK